MNNPVDLEYLTARAEQGDAIPLGEALDRIAGFEERFELLKKIERLNETNRRLDPNLPDLVLTFSPVNRRQPITGETAMSASLKLDPPGWWSLNQSILYSETVLPFGGMRTRFYSGLRR